MRITKYRQSELPAWVWDNILKVCPHCGCMIVENDTMTARWCSNPECPEHMAYKIVEVCNFYGVKGMGPATAKEWILSRNLHSQFEIIPLLFDTKPTASLADIATLACIEGYGSIQAEKELPQMHSFEEYFSVGEPNPLLVPYKDLLIGAQKYFNIKKPVSARKLYVMGTGSFHGFNNRDSFFSFINMHFGQYVHVIQTGRRKTGVSFLIKEEDAVDHSKSQLARENNIPIVTPTQFIAILLKAFNISIEEIYANNKEV